MDILVIILREGAINLIEIGKPFPYFFKFVAILFLKLFADLADEGLELDHFL
jgi:hypothetical protein